jgi:hypothetical protein
MSDDSDNGDPSSRPMPGLPPGVRRIAGGRDEAGRPVVSVEFETATGERGALVGTVPQMYHLAAVLWRQCELTERAAALDLRLVETGR